MYSHPILMLCCCRYKSRQHRSGSCVCEWCT